MRKRRRKGALITSIDVMQKLVFSSIMRLLSSARAYARSQESTSFSSQTAYVKYTEHDVIVSSLAQKYLCGGNTFFVSNYLYQYQFIISDFTAKPTNINLNSGIGNVQHLSERIL